MSDIELREHFGLPFFRHVFSLHLLSTNKRIIFFFASSSCLILSEDNIFVQFFYRDVLSLPLF